MRKLLWVLLAFIAYTPTVFAQTESTTVDPDFSQRDVLTGVAADCEICREPATKITLSTASSITVYSNNLLYYKQSITISTSPARLIRQIKADLTYFEFQPESDDCFPCNKNSATFGNFDNCTITNQAAVGAGTHSISWAFLPPKASATFPAIFNITLPPSVKCCTGTIRWCVRYIIEFDDCSVCSKTVCYEKKKTTTTTAPTVPVNPTLLN